MHGTLEVVGVTVSGRLRCLRMMSPQYGDGIDNWRASNEGGKYIHMNRRQKRQSQDGGKKERKRGHEVR